MRPFLRRLSPLFASDLHVTACHHPPKKSVKHCSTAGHEAQEATDTEFPEAFDCRSCKRQKKYFIIMSLERDSR